MVHKKKIAMLLLLLLSFYGSVVTGQTSVQIESANESGVAGYPITIFGSGFGAQVGEVRVLDVSADIELWTPTAIRAVIPAVANGQGELVVRANNGQFASNPFTVYSIDPAFLAPPTETYRNVLTGRQAKIEGFEWSYCAAQPNNVETKAELFLSNYRCGYKGIARSGLVVLGADSDLGTAAHVAYQFSQPLRGEYVFQFVTDNVWYEREVDTSYLHSVPKTYFLEISADSTDGKDGTWTAVFEVDGNRRSTRTHRISIAPESEAIWFRMRVTDGLTNVSEFEGRDFALREVRLFAAAGDSPARPDAAAIYGDSLAADAFEALGPSGLPHAVKQLRGDDRDLIFSSFGLAGQNSSGLVEQPGVSFDIYDALALDDAAAQIRYWFIALGTNDALDGAAAIDTPNANLYEHAGRLDQFVQDAVARGLVPIVARIPQTDESKGGFGDAASKRHVLRSIDAVAARYRLIPGPDLYAAFRLNLETEKGSYFGDDGTHHVDLGGQRLINLWAEAFVNGVDYETRMAVALGAISAETADVAAVEDVAGGEAVVVSSTPTAIPAIGDGVEDSAETSRTQLGGQAETLSASGDSYAIAAALFGVLLLLSFGVVFAAFRYFELV